MYIICKNTFQGLVEKGPPVCKASLQYLNIHKNLLFFTIYVQGLQLRGYIWYITIYFLCEYIYYVNKSWINNNTCKIDKFQDGH